MNFRKTTKLVLGLVGLLSLAACTQESNTSPVLPAAGQAYTAEPEAEFVIQDAEARGGNAAILYRNQDRATFQLGDVPDGTYRVEVRARAHAYEGWPIMRLTSGGARIGNDTPVERERYGSSTQGFGVAELKQGQVITASFLNDLYRGSADTDRNLIIDHLILKPTGDPSAPKKPAPQPGTSVAPNGALIRDGEPFFPVGFYGPLWRSSSMEERFEAIDIFAREGFNTIFLEDIATPRYDELLSAASEKNLGVLVGFTNLKSYPEYPPEESVRKFRDHPAVLGWSLMDDADNGEWSVQEIEKREASVKTLDPNHISFLTLTTYYQKRRDEASVYADLADAIAPQIYPITPLPDYEATPETALTNAYERTLIYAKAAEAEGAAPFMTPQTFTWGEHTWQGRELEDARYPTALELRNMVYSGLAAGVKGLIAYRYSPELVNESQGTWQEYIAIKDDILGRTQDFYLRGTLSRRETGDPELVLSTYEYQDELLLIAVNTSYREPKRLAVSLRDTYTNLTPIAARMPATLALARRELDGTLAPQAVQVYVLSK